MIYFLYSKLLSNILSLFSSRDLLDLDLNLDVSHFHKSLLRWERGNYCIQVCHPFIQHRSIEIVDGPYVIV